MCVPPLSSSVGKHIEEKGSRGCPNINIGRFPEVREKWGNLLLFLTRISNY